MFNFNKLFEMIKDLSGNSDIFLGDMRVDGKKILIELDLVEPANVDDDIIKE